MGDLSKNFSRHEFACKCGCGLNTVDAELIKVLQDVRDHFQAPIEITSGCRCLKHNTDVGGSVASKHMEAKAADITMWSDGPTRIHYYLTHNYPEKYGIGNYKTFTHIDVRNNRARW